MISKQATIVDTVCYFIKLSIYSLNLIDKRYFKIINNVFFQSFVPFNLTVGQFRDDFLVNFNPSQICISVNIFIVIMQQHRNIIQWGKSQRWDIFLKLKQLIGFLVKF